MPELWGALQAHYARLHSDEAFLTPGLQEAVLCRLKEMEPEICFRSDSNPGGDLGASPQTAWDGSDLNGVVLQVRASFGRGGQADSGGQGRRPCTASVAQELGGQGACSAWLAIPQ